MGRLFLDCLHPYSMRNVGETHRWPIRDFEIGAGLPGIDLSHLLGCGMQCNDESDTVNKEYPYPEKKFAEPERKIPSKFLRINEVTLYP